jgi:hypothetical protein
VKSVAKNLLVWIPIVIGNNNGKKKAKKIPADFADKHRKTK